MTFEEWWKSKKTLIETVVNNNKYHIDLIVFIKSIMNIAWDTSQPKWTLCKDGLPNYNEPCLLKIESSTGISIVCGYLEPYEPSEDEFGYGKVHTLDIFNVISVDCYSLVDSDPIDDERVIAWMPLPEAPGNIDK